MNENLELKRRIEVLYTENYTWLLQASKNICKNQLEAEDLIGDLFLYLLEKGNPKIYYKNSINTLYCYRFLQTRWINKIVKRNKLPIHKPKNSFIEDNWDMQDEVYSYEEDERIMQSFDLVQEELKRLSTTREWSKAKLFSLYYENDHTMLELANKIGICKSTMFVTIKKIREHLKSTCPNPFQNA